MWHPSPPQAVRVEEPPEHRLQPVTVSIIWRRSLSPEGYHWDFFCRAPLSDVERIVYWDQQQTGLSNEDYAVKQG